MYFLVSKEQFILFIMLYLNKDERENSHARSWQKGNMYYGEPHSLALDFNGGRRLARGFCLYLEYVSLI